MTTSNWSAFLELGGVDVVLAGKQRWDHLNSSAQVAAPWCWTICALLTLVTHTHTHNDCHGHQLETV